MSADKVKACREAVLKAADHYAIAEGSGADTSEATADLAAELDDFEEVVREDERARTLASDLAEDR